MEKYIVFQYDNYYPRGGMMDITGSYHTIEEAKETFGLDRGCVVDRDTWQVVFIFD